MHVLNAGARTEGTNGEFIVEGHFAHTILLVFTTRWGKLLPVDPYRCFYSYIDMVVILNMPI